MNKIEDGNDLVSFDVGDLFVGVDISHVQEITRNCRMTPVPRVPDHIRGVMNLRGEVVTVFDLRMILEGKPTDLEQRTHAVIVRHDDESSALLVGHIGDVVPSASAEVEPPPPHLNVSDTRMFRGVLRVGQRLMVLLNLENMFDQVQTALDGLEQH